MVLRVLVLAGVLLMGGCATTSVNPRSSPDHPASVDAPEATYAPSPSALAEGRTGPPPGPASRASSSESSHEHDGKSPQPTDIPGLGATTTGSQPATQHQQANAIYTCPMHPEVVQNVPGRCPKCGMPLVKKPEPHMGEHHE